MDSPKILVIETMLATVRVYLIGGGIYIPTAAVLSTPYPPDR